jgi:hypothetical protein
MEETVRVILAEQKLTSGAYICMYIYIYEKSNKTVTAWLKIFYLYLYVNNHAAAVPARSRHNGEAVLIPLDSALIIVVIYSL